MYGGVVLATSSLAVDAATAGAIDVGLSLAATTRSTDGALILSSTLESTDGGLPLSATTGSTEDDVGLVTSTRTVDDSVTLSASAVAVDGGESVTSESTDCVVDLSSTTGAMNGGVALATVSVEVLLDSFMEVVVFLSKISLVVHSSAFILVDVDSGLLVRILTSLLVTVFVKSSWARQDLTNSSLLTFPSPLSSNSKKVV